MICFRSLFLLNHILLLVPGQSHTLTCKAYFDFEINISQKVQWFMNYGGNVKNKTLLRMESPQ